MADEAHNREIVEAGYDSVADRYAELEAPGREWPRMRWLAKLLGQIDRGGAVLDVGCGNGIPATRAMSERFDATGIDISAAQIQRARENVPEARFLHGDLLGADFGEEFDAIAAFYVVDHVERERHASIFDRFHRWLRPSGWVLLSIEPEAEPGSVRDWLGRPMFFSQYDAETTLELIRAAGFQVVEHAVESQLEGERQVSFLWVLARKARRPSASAPVCR